MSICDKFSRVVKLISNVVTEEVAKLIMTPDSNILLISKCIIFRRRSINPIVDNAPTIAINVTAIFPILFDNPKTKAIATPNTAPPDSPIVYGSTSGLRNKLCIITPDIESIAPTPIAIKTLGTRNSKSMIKSV
jgi:hypothetical protein